MAGSTALRERLRDDICSGRLAHAYILEGAAGTGKHMLAVRIAAALACENRNRDGIPLPCMECAACRKILSGNSPDLISVSRADKATLGVEAIRAIHSDVWVAPNELDCKLYLIEDAHLMTVQAQNAFLLTLEEPPAYVRFLLLCESVAPLLETVRSRAPALRLQHLSQQEIGAHLCSRYPEAKALSEQSPSEFRELLAAADGSIGKALLLLDPKQRKPILERRNTVREFVRLCGARRNSGAVIGFLGAMGQKREDITAQLQAILLCMRDLLLCKQTEHAPLCFFADREEAYTLSYRFSAPELLRLCNCLTQATDRLRRNANVRLTLTEFAVEAGLLP